ncbi:MAG TPA: histidine phosphatase family protein [Terriglobales bacterium]|nr:histidine phosphatase family protein [Terriglobales bacterium]
MSHLVLVRHGQASFLEKDYDRLSPKGERQGLLLGEYWARHKIIFEHVYSGPKLRQRHTARLAGEAYRDAGLPWPETELLPEFDEFQAEAVIDRTLPGLIENDERIRCLHREFQAATTRPAQFKTFQRLFEVVIGRWAAGELPLEGIEPWPDFVARVRGAIRKLTGNGARGRRIAIFTSGGPMAVAMQYALELSTPATLKTAWMVRNCAFSEFLFTPERFTLSFYNATPHLTDPELLTHR